MSFCGASSAFFELSHQAIDLDNWSRMSPIRALAIFLVARRIWISPPGRLAVDPRCHSLSFDSRHGKGYLLVQAKAEWHWASPAAARPSALEASKR